jgi:hypothetical protein
MNDKHGLGWAYDEKIGFSENELEQIVMRKKDEERSTDTTAYSDILEYTYILDLKKIIERNWQDFAKILPSKATTTVYLEKLGYLRNPAAHVRNMNIHSKYLCLGICGEILNHIQSWLEGYRRTVKGFYCEFRFSAYTQHDNSEIAQNKTHDMALDWIKLIESKSSQAEEFRDSIEFGQEKIIHLPEGILSISVPKVVPQYNGRYFSTAIIQVFAANSKVMDKLINEGHQPCQVIYWLLNEKLDVQSFSSSVYEFTNKQPSSSSGIGPPEKTILTGADYYILRDNNISLRAHVSNGGFRGAGSTVGLVYEGEINNGFHRAHQIFTPDIILSVVAGRTTIPQVRHLVDKATVPIQQD